MLSRMITVSDFLKFLIREEPQNNLARLCLYQYLNNYVIAESHLNTNIWEQFLGRALSFPHWQKNAAVLSAECEKIFLLWNQKAAANNQPFLDSQSFRLPDQVQPIRIESINDFYEITNRYSQTQLQPGEKLRILPDHEAGMVALFFAENRGLKVRYYSPLMTIRKGDIEPLCLDQQITYNSDFSLAPHRTHHVAVGDFQFCIFQSQAKSFVTGKVLRGFTLQKLEQFDWIDYRQKPSLMFAIKKLERFFIDREQDPIYQELVQLAENSLTLLQEDTPQAIQFAQEALLRGQNAAENIFPDDKLLTVLLRELDRELTRKIASSQNKDQLCLNPQPVPYDSINL